jgi:ubiquinone biosynthesis protein COQ4
MNFLEKIQFAKSFFSIVDDPQKTEHIFKIGSIGMRYPNSPSVQNMVNHVFSDPEFQRQYEEKYLLDRINMEELGRLPDGTLGKEFYIHMTKNNLNVDFFPKEDITVPVKYIVMRLRQVHDIWHVLAGYDTSLPGELALQAFYIAQAKSGVSSVLLAGGFLHSSKFGTDSHRYMDIIIGGYNQGKNAKPLLRLKYETLWDRQLDDLRRELNICPPLSF